MTRILNILEEFLKEIERDNPYRLIAKGGTALAIYHLDYHRESEDLDFDTDLDKQNYKKIESYFLKILQNLKNKNVIKNYGLGKSGLANTNRYHMKLQLESYKIFHTKIDVDFIKSRKTKSLNMKGKLFLYKIEEIFISKAISFINRREFKDAYDLFYILPKTNANILREYPNIAELLDRLINSIQEEDMINLYKNAFRNVDLKFKDLKEEGIKKFVSGLTVNLRILKNKLE